MPDREMCSILAVALVLLCSGCKTSAPAPREPADLPLDDIDVAVADGGAGDLVQVEAGDGGVQDGGAGVAGGVHPAGDAGPDGAGTGSGDPAGSEGAGGGEQEEQLGIDLRGD